MKKYCDPCGCSGAAGKRHTTQVPAARHRRVRQLRTHTKFTVPPQVVVTRDTRVQPNSTLACALHHARALRALLASSHVFTLPYACPCAAVLAVTLPYMCGSLCWAPAVGPYSGCGGTCSAVGRA